MDRLDGIPTGGRGIPQSIHPRLRRCVSIGQVLFAARAIQTDTVREAQMREREEERKMASGEALSCIYPMFPSIGEQEWRSDSNGSGGCVEETSRKVGTATAPRRSSSVIRKPDSEEREQEKVTNMLRSNPVLVVQETRSSAEDECQTFNALHRLEKDTELETRSPGLAKVLARGRSIKRNRPPKL